MAAIIEDVCSICLENLNKKENVFTCYIPGCKHVFHTRCLVNWCRQSEEVPPKFVRNICPNCRQVIPEDFLNNLLKLLRDY